MLKIKINSKNNQAREKFPRKFPGNIPNPWNPEDIQNPGIPGNCSEIFLFPGSLKIREKGKPYLGGKNTDCRLARRKIWPLILADFVTPTEKGCPSLSNRFFSFTEIL